MRVGRKKTVVTRVRQENKTEANEITLYSFKNSFISSVEMIVPLKLTLQNV
jgi:hypothetical protein